jgi:hypothetical protein
MPRFLQPSGMANFSRFCLVGVICFASLGLLSQPSLAQIDPIQQYDQIFGSPENFLDNFKQQASEDLNQYIGAGVAVSCFVLAIRAMFR